MDIHIYKYNNYYNRILKQELTLTEYGDPIHSEIDCKSFNPNDGVNTSVVIGTAVTNYNGEGDYLIIADNDQIVSRWFIIDITFTRNGQWQINLRRDLFADFYDEWVNAPAVIEKGNVPEGNPLIFNSENIAVNQIKTKETLLKDETKCQWLVGYVARQSTEEGGGPSLLSAKIKYNLDFIPDDEVSSINELPFYQYLDRETSYTGGFTIDTFFKANDTTVTFTSINEYGQAKPPLKYKTISVEEGFGYCVTTIPANQDNYDYGYGNTDKVKSFLNKTPAATVYNKDMIYGNRHFAQYLYNAIPSSSWSSLKRMINSASGGVEVSEISQYANKIYKIGDSYFKTVLEITPRDEDQEYISTSIPQLEQIFRQYYNTAAAAYGEQYGYSLISQNISTNPGDGKTLIGIRAAIAGTAKLTLVPFTDTKVQAEINTDGLALSCVDSPYDIITMPYSDTLEIITDENVFTANKELALATMTALLSQQGGAGPVKDVQLLPYCPLRQFIDADGNLDLTLTNEDPNESFSTRVYYVTVERTSIPLTPLIYCQYSTDSFNIPVSINVKNTKMETLCDMYRLCSPNFAAMFEFNAAKNGGVQFFNVDFNYRPYNPYIHINPNFDRLYGQDFNDPRGLICAGDFSITSVTDQWAQYELQNKNYEKSFQRQIENMKTQNKYAKELELMSIITGTVQGGATGAAAGGMAGGPWGAAAGAVIGTGASLFGGMRDREINNALRAEALDYTQDQFAFQIDNIQALSNTISKVTTINANNKGFPVLEYYTCTDIEKEAVANKIAWNGMSIGTISTPINFMGNSWAYQSNSGTITSKGYIKGRILRIEDLEDDFHLLKSISDEFYKGVYIQ